MSTYPGNASLSNAVKERVISTFQQTLALYKQGRSDEVVQGCGLILRMDPMFDPAKKLMEKARNPAAAIDVEKLLAVPAGGDALAAARAAMAKRDFQKVIEITTEVLTNDLMNDEARVLNEQAREKLEATPFVDQFIKKTEKAIAGGDVAAARAGLEKIRSLDADDTAIARIEQAIGKMKPPAGGPSFVVDSPPASSGRGTAQASDFGFTFEEEKAHQGDLGAFSFDAGSTASPFSTDTGTVPPVTPPGGFSFDSTTPTPPPMPKATPPAEFSFDTPLPQASPLPGGFSFNTPTGTPAATPPPLEQKSTFSGEFDFTTASIETSPDDQKKIQEYLAEGDRAFEAGDDQKAIDLWSRIFLLDVTNDAASERIEKAKARRKADENDLDGLISSGKQAFDRGDRKGAREIFTRALQIDPQNSTVKDYLEQLIEVGTEGGAAGYQAPVAPTPSATVDDLFTDEPPAAGTIGSSAGAAGAPARAAVKKPAAKPASKPVPQKRQLPTLAIGVVAAVLLLGAGGWVVWSKFLSKPKYDPAKTAAIFKDATALADKGLFDAAITSLRDVPNADPQHDKALSMIADLQRKKAQASESIAGRPANAVYAEALANGKAAFDAHDYDAAKKAFDTAVRIKPLPPDVKPMYDTVSQQVAKLEGAKELFKEQRYQDALTNLLVLQQTDPDNQSIRRMIVAAHFNLGALALQEDRLPDAAREFDEVLKIDPNDDLAKRSKALAERYASQGKDLLYKIYVKYLPMRTTG